MEHIGRTNVMTGLELCRPRVSVSVTLSAVAGFILSSRGDMPGIISMVAGMLLLTGGCSALNQYQERDTDARMERTRERPIPSGRILPVRALILSLILVCGGLLVIFLSGGGAAAMLGLAGVAAYNGMYTFLKKKTEFAVVPGALIGAIPPAVGWVSAGGAILNFRLGVLCFFFFIWQMPHFWLLLLRYGEEYERAGLPSLTRILSRQQLKRIVFTWTLAGAASCQIISAFGVEAHAVKACLAVLAIFCVINAVIFLRRGEYSFQAAFGRLNLYMFIVLLLVATDRALMFLQVQGQGFLAGI